MDRDESMDRLLEHALRGSAEPETPNACLDAETVAAFSDGSLSARDRQAAEAHAATCDRCLLLLATLDSVRPAPEAGSWWARWRTARWLVPLTAAATAIAIWVAVQDAPRDQLATAVVTAPPPPPVPSGKPVTSTAPVGNELAAREAAQKRVQAPAATLDERARPSSAPVVPPPSADARSDRQERALAAVKEAESANRDAASARVADAAVPISPPPPVAKPGSISEDVIGATKAAAGARPVAELRQSSAFRAATAIEVASPDPLVRWRLIGTMVDRSTDGGSTWQTQPTGSTVPLLAGSCPSVTVCWFVGRGGTVLVTTDGVTWQTRAAPEASDLVAIKAGDESVAIAVTRTGRIYRTTDGGRTWAAQ
jgi:hypothetical protein